MSASTSGSGSDRARRRRHAAATDERECRSKFGRAQVAALGDNPRLSPYERSRQLASGRNPASLEHPALLNVPQRSPRDPPRAGRAIGPRPTTPSDLSETVQPPPPRTTAATKSRQAAHDLEPVDPSPSLSRRRFSCTSETMRKEQTGGSRSSDIRLALTRVRGADPRASQLAADDHVASPARDRADVGGSGKAERRGSATAD
jgi:hypothetical protein